MASSKDCVHVEARAQRLAPCSANRLAQAGAVAITLGAFALYMHTLGQQSLWFDEGLSVTFAMRPLPQLMHTLVYEDLHPPLYYLLLHFWMMLAGSSEWAVRLPSLASAVLLAPLAFATAMEIGRHGRSATALRAAGLAAAALIGTSPFLAYYAQEARMYSLAAALALAGTWAYMRAVGGARRSWWLLFSVLLAASLYTQYMSVFVLPAYWVYALLLNRKSLTRTLHFSLLAGLLYLPWAAPVYLQLGRLLRSPDYWVSTHIDPVSFLRAMWRAFLPNTRMRWGVLAGGIGLAGAIATALRRGFRLSERVRRTALVFLTALTPLGLTFVAVRLAPKFAARYTIVAAAPLYVCAAVVLWALVQRTATGRALFVLATAAGLLLSLHSTLRVLRGIENPRDDARGLASYLSENAQPDDVLLLVENAPYALQYYYHGPAAWYGLHVGQEFPQVTRTLDGLLSTQPKRVWLVLWHYEFADPSDLVVTELLRVAQEASPQPQFRGYWLRAFDIAADAPPPTDLRTPSTQTSARFAPGLTLLGFDRLDSGAGKVHYVFFWEAERPLLRNYRLTLSFRDADNIEYLRYDRPLSTDYFLPPAWPVSMTIQGRVDVLLPSDLPPLTYLVQLRVFDPVSQSNLDLVDSGGAPQGQTVALQQLALSKANLSNSPAHVETLLQVEMGGIELTGYQLSGAKYSQGESMLLTLWWQRSTESLTQASSNLVSFRLVDMARQVAWDELRPILAGHPVADWLPGEFNRSSYRLAVPSDLPGGDYLLQVAIGNAALSLLQVQVSAREHTYDLPSMQQVLGIEFEQGISLLGYDVQPPAMNPVKAMAPLTVTLYWQANERLTTNYKVSVQALSSDRRIVGQDDSVPMRWTYPTTSWLPREVITDEHVLTITPGSAAGSHVLIVALYDETTGQRLNVRQSDATRDYAVLTALRVAP